MKVLVVDDSGTMRYIVKAALAEIGLNNIIEAENGKAALIQIDAHMFDLILMDLNIPDMSGLEALKLIRSNPKFRDVPVLVVSAVRDKARIMEVLQAGAADFLIKPFSTESMR